MLYNKHELYVSNDTRGEFMKKITIATLILSLTLALTACGTTENTGTKDTLKVGCSNFSNSLDPSADANSAWGTARYGIGETLFMFDENMNAIPNLATSYDVNDEKTVWEIQLRDDVYFSNGTKMTPETVKTSLDYIYAQEASGAGSNKVSQFIQIEEVVANDDSITIKTLQPYVDLSKILSHVNFVIIDVNGSDDISLSPIGTGPYAISEHSVGISAKLVANEYYWKGDVGFDFLELKFMTDSTTKALALQSGDIDFADSITTSNDLDFLRNSNKYSVYETLSARTAFSYINHDGILSNDVLREAILLAIDDDTIAEITTGGVYTSAFSILPSTLDYGFEKLVDKTPYNLEKAIELLDNAGIIDTDGNGIRELDGNDIVIDFIGSTNKSLDTICEAIEINLSELGIKTNVNIVDSTTVWNMTITGEHDLAICSWMTVPDGSPVSFLESFYSKSPSDMNHGNYASEAYDAIYEQLVLEFDSAVQKELITELQQILIDDCAVMVHGVYTSNLSSNNLIEGLVMSMSEAYWVTADIKPAN